MKEKEIIYYDDELNNEFSKAQIKPRKIDEHYKYSHSWLWDICSLFIQNVLSMPIKTLYLKIKFKHKYIGKEKLKGYEKQGYFVYANHTQAFADTFIPSVAIYPKRNFLIVNPENISMKPFGWLVEMLGAIPVPGNKTAMKNFLDTIEEKIHKGYAISIYPEAHIWPYYTKIRPFKAVSFKYPVKLDKPTFCITNTYQKYGEDKIKMVSYIDGPFFANKELEIKERQQNLRDRVFECMTKRANNSNIEKIKYIKKLENFLKV